VTGGELLRRGTAVLRQAGLDWPRLEAEVLLAHAWGRSREELLIHPEQEAPEAAARQFMALAGQRAGGVPAAYLTGAREFMSLLMAVTPAVLIPRPETEVLVEEVLRWLASRPARPVLRAQRARSRAQRRCRVQWTGRGSLRSQSRWHRTWHRRFSGRGTVFDQPLVADVGTGSGAIAVSLAHCHLAVQVTAIDISEAALEVAAVNAARHGLADRISFLTGDLLAPLLERGDAGAGTTVAANLPYIPTAAWDRLPPEVRREPRLALDGGGDGLDLYRRLLPQAAAWLAPGGLLACEIGPGQAEVLIELLQQDSWRLVRLIRDYRGEERVVTALRTEDPSW
jgi:release factor glutamine methyltransferase